MDEGETRDDRKLPIDAAALFAFEEAFAAVDVARDHLKFLVARIARLTGDPPPG